MVRSGSSCVCATSVCETPSSSTGRKREKRFIASVRSASVRAVSVRGEPLMPKTPQYTEPLPLPGGWCSVECSAGSDGRVCVPTHRHRLRLLWRGERQTYDANHGGEVGKSAVPDHAFRHHASAQFVRAAD